LRLTILHILLLTACRAIYSQNTTIEDQINKAKSGLPQNSILELNDVLNRNESIDTLNLGMINYLIAARFDKLDLCDSVLKYDLVARKYFDAAGYAEYRYPRSFILAGDCLKREGQYSESIQYYQNSLEVDVRGEWAYNIQNYSAIQIGIIHRQSGEYYKAHTAQNKWMNHINFDSISVDQKIDAYLTKSINENNLRLYKEAQFSLKEMNELISRLAEQEQPNYKANYYNQKGIVERSKNDLASMLKTYKKLVDLMEQAGYEHFTKEFIVRAYLNLSGASSYTGSYDEGKSRALKALSLFDKFELSDGNLYQLIIDNLASAFIGLQQFDQADHLLETVISEGDSLNLSALNLINLSYDLSRSKYKNYTENNHSSLLARSSEILEDNLYSIDSVLFSSYAETTILSLKNRLAEIYALYLDVAHASYDMPTFWEITEKSKGLLLLESSVNRSYIDQTMAEEHLQTLDSLNREIRSLEFEKSKAGSSFTDERNLAELQYDRLTIKERIHVLEKENPLNTVQPEALGIEEGEMIIQYKYGQEHLYAMTIKSDGVSELIKLSPNEEVDSLLHGYNCVSTSDCDGEAAGALYNILVEPLGVLPRQLTIIPDGPLSFLPFESLMDKNGKYLIESSTVNYAISATHLWQQTQKNSIDFSSRLFAPDYDMSDLTDLYESLSKGDDNDFKYLAYSKEESDYLKDLMNATLTEGNVSKETLLDGLQEASIFHFTGHGYQDANDHRFSFLALTDDSDQYESIITAAEIDQAHTNADLVVLNACNTGTGELISGEGVFSLARSFFKAGAKSVVNSLWSIDDQSSSQIMVDFYTNLKQGQSKSEALRNAKLTYINTAPDHKRHPYYWAGLILIGDDSPIEMGKDSYVWTMLGIFAFVILGIFLWRQWYEKAL